MDVYLTNGLELQFLEILIFFLLIIPIVRVFIYARRPLNGLVWTPPIALVVNIAVFPAYGFHFECALLLLCNIIFNIVNLRVVLNKSALFYKPNIIHIVLAILVLSTTALAVYFSPIQGEASVSFTTKTFFDKDEQRVFTVRLYPENVSIDRSGCKGVVVVAPPFESIDAVNRICAALASTLASQGFLVVALAPRSTTIIERIAFLQARLWGTSSERANKLGKRFEGEKKNDVLFLLSRLESLLHGQDVPVFLLGYDASGSAVYFLAAEDETVENYRIKGAVAVESRFWSLYYRKEPTVEIPEGFSRRLMFNIRAGLAALKPKKVNHIETASAPKVPFLFLTSDRIVNTAFRDKQYAATLKLLHFSVTADGAVDNNAILLAREGAGPFDYMDYPETHPLFSSLNSGATRPVNGPEWRKKSVSATVAVIAEFIESALAGRELRADGYYRE
ncbi:MAG: hypothetical protein LBE74_03685 [Treponema sp.]|jgi:hypothetical protein|nr:hypothetical protein [Treponema sp.]